MTVDGNKRKQLALSITLNLSVAQVATLGGFLYLVSLACNANFK